MQLQQIFALVHLPEGNHSFTIAYHCPCMHITQAALASLCCAFESGICLLACHTCTTILCYIALACKPFLPRKAARLQNSWTISRGLTAKSEDTPYVFSTPRPGGRFLPFRECGFRFCPSVGSASPAASCFCSIPLPATARKGVFSLCCGMPVSMSGNGMASVATVLAHTPAEDDTHQPVSYCSHVTHGSSA